jgi:hypothetical protein
MNKIKSYPSFIVRQQKGIFMTTFERISNLIIQLLSSKLILSSNLNGEPLECFKMPWHIGAIKAERVELKIRKIKVEMSFLLSTP